MKNGIIELSVSDDLPDHESVVLDEEAVLLTAYLKETILAIMRRANDDQGGALHTGEHG